MLKNASWLTLVRVACDLLQFLLFMAFSRHYGPEGIGHYAYALAIAGLVFALVHLGFEDLAIRDLARLPREERPSFLGRLLALQMLISIAVCLLLVGFVFIGSHDSATSMAVLIMSAYYLQYGFIKTLFTPAFAQNQMVRPALVELVARLLIICTAIFLVWELEVSLPVALLPYPLIGLALVIAAALSARSYLGPLPLGIDWRQARETVRAAWPFGAALLIFTLQVRVSFILLARMLGPEATGIFASSLKFLEFGIFPFVFLALSCYPNLSRFHLRRPEDFRRLANRLYFLSLAGGALLTWALVFPAPGLITRLFGAPFAASVPVLQSMAILGILMAADIPAGRIMQAARLQRQRASCMLVGVVVTIVLVLLLVPPLGLYGAVLANIVGQMVITGLSLSSLQLHAGRMLDRRFELLAGGVLLGGGMAGALSVFLGGKLWHSALVALLAGAVLLLAGGVSLWRKRLRDDLSDSDEDDGGMPRVCFLLESYHPVVGGMESQARTLVEDFAGRGVRVMVVTRRSHQQLKRREEIGGVAICRVGPVGDGQLRRWALLFTCLPILLYHYRSYDLLHVMGFRVLGVPALLVAWLFHKKTILRAETNGEFSGAFFTPGLARLHLSLSSRPLRLLLDLRNRLLRTADRYVSISSQITAELRGGGVPAERIEELPNAVDVQRFHPVSAEHKAALRKRLGLPMDRPVLAFSGRLVSFKGVPQLLEVWQAMVRDGRRGLLLLIGGGGSDLHNCEPQLRAEVLQNGLMHHVHFTGDVSNVHEYLQAADLFAFPTAEEAFGIALVEAMACALPVVTTQVGGLRDIVRHGENGWVVAAGDTGQLRQALEHLLDHPPLAVRLGEGALLTVLQRYERQMLADRYLQLLCATVQQQNRGGEVAARSLTGEGLHGISKP
jgi:O-antigen/teichoic acid export membrane protein/glycosyltransferase involved in cell wall biosynthesis